MQVSNQIQLVQTKHSHVFTVQLNLSHQTRYLGKIDTAGDGTFSTNRKKKHIFKKTNAIGINYQLLKDESIKYKWILIDLEGKKLITSREYFLSKGKCFEFNNKGFELQCFLPIDEFGMDKVKTFERANPKQESLFAA